MRIITGSARGKRLITLEGNDVRPTGDRVKEALFSAIQFDLDGSYVLDLFAGSGQLGLEALSRGAAFVSFYDTSKEAIRVIGANATACGFDPCTYEVRHGDGLALAGLSPKRYDIAFVDPPYHAGLYREAFITLTAVMKAGATVICEHPGDVPLPESVGPFSLIKTYRFGRVFLSKYQREADHE